MNAASSLVRRGRRVAVAAALVSSISISISTIALAAQASTLPPLLAGAEGFADRGFGAIRGITLGPIENSRHPDRGYGSGASARSMVEARALGASWVSLTPFGRVADLKPTGIDLTFETPFEQNRRDVLGAIHQAHAEGLKVFLVPHLWVESGAWRAEIDPGDDAAWARWTDAYRSFLLTWAEVAAEGEVEMLSVGVELRSWATTTRAQSLVAIVNDVRRVYPGLLTYSANWDDVGDTAILGAIDLIGINAFYPLADHDGASPAELAEGGRKVKASIEALARAAGKPVVLTEIGYTTRPDPAVKPWEWPDGMKDVKVDERAQAEAYRALIAPFLDARWCAGLFVWRFYADPDDVSQEAEWGFSPRGKLAELVMRDAFTARWATDPVGPIGDLLGRSRARTPGVFGWTLAPTLRFEP